ncbi:sorting nexin-2-like [Sycon ciliatum]|uniref:sorting nexin-2-like n=1 Tax=Sycon ciliatum TaxID=27933 RepID=UPI0020A9EB27|eukprot:scpid55020/ scgid22906/ Sorting nexin-2
MASETTEQPSSPRPSLSLSNLSEDSEDVVLVRVDGGAVLMATPVSDGESLHVGTNLDTFPEESSGSHSPSESPKTEGEATAAEATMPAEWDGEATGRMTDELEAEFEAFLKAQSDGGATESATLEMDEAALYQMEVTVTEPIKQGEGMSSYLTYHITTKTNLPQFRSSEVSVRRKYSEFQSLQSRLVNTYLKKGCLLPQLPESNTIVSTVGSAVGMTRSRAIQPQAQSSTSCAAMDLVERRRAALQRYLNRVASHPLLRLDSDFHEFLQANHEIEKPVGVSVMSTEGVTKLFKGVTNAIAKITARMSESDDWFDDKHKQYDALSKNLKSLHTALEGLAADRKDLANTSSALSRGVDILSGCETNVEFSEALAQFATVHENIQQIRLKQVDTDFFIMSEMIKDHLTMQTSIRACFQQRILAFQSWQSSQTSLLKKRDEETRLLVAKTLKREKVDYCREEISRWEKRVEEGQKEFESISKTIQEEIKLYETERLKEFRAGLIQYLEKLMRHQQQMNKHWEEMLTIAKATSTSSVAPLTET